ncbi:hypothetical protein [Paenibacillus piri]|uniref:hypothetical protein n=1 Tax=Paenibacillus piri TaxID=2547395 RepID=UPI00319E3ADA
MAPVEADLMFLTDKPYYHDFLTVYQKKHPHFVINPDALQFYQGRRKLEDIWEFIEQILNDKQVGDARTTTLKSLRKVLKEIDD